MMSMIVVVIGDSLGGCFSCCLIKNANFSLQLRAAGNLQQLRRFLSASSKSQSLSDAEQDHRVSLSLEVAAVDAADAAIISSSCYLSTFVALAQMGKVCVEQS